MPPEDLIIQDTLDTMLALLKQAYQETIDKALQKDDELYIVAHGYDYPIPNGKPIVIYGINTHKAWIKPVMGW